MQIEKKKKKLQEIQIIRHPRYLDLLTSARVNDTGILRTFPTASEYEFPMSRIFHALKTKVELLDSFHDLDNREENLPFNLSQHSFGLAIWINLKQTTL